MTGRATAASSDRPPVAIVHPLALPPRGRRSPTSTEPYPGPLGTLAPVIGPIGPIVARTLLDPVTALDLDVAALPEGDARPEALAILVRRAGGQLRWGEPIDCSAPTEAERFAFERGRSSVRIMRSAPSLLPELQVGSWFNAGWRGRALTRLLMRAPRLATVARRLSSRPQVLRMAADVSFWRGVRSLATKDEWRRLTRSSYVAFCYHELSHGREPVDPELDVPASRFRGQLRLLRLLGFRPLTLEELASYHDDTASSLGRRRYLLTADDGYRQALDSLAQADAAHPVAFVIASFAADPPRGGSTLVIADLDAVRAARRAGVAIGVHGSWHRSLVACDDEQLAEELASSAADLDAFDHADVFAYPYGHHDARVRDAVRRAGYQLAFTTEAGLNSAGTDRWCLRRISIKPSDDLLSFAWKAFTGQQGPRILSRRRG
jgi:peptidoglycan/xylan/chitin deacetylase (PgdA/CDA1 family)